MQYFLFWGFFLSSWIQTHRPNCITIQSGSETLLKIGSLCENVPLPTYRYPLTLYLLFVAVKNERPNESKISDSKPSATRISFVADLKYCTKNEPLICRTAVVFITIRLIPFLRENFLGEVSHQPSGEKVDIGRIEIPKPKGYHDKVSAYVIGEEVQKLVFHSVPLGEFL